MVAISQRLPELIVRQPASSPDKAPSANKLPVRSDRIARFYSHFPAGALISTLAAASIALHFREVAVHRPWFFAMLAAAALQFVGWAAYRSPWLRRVKDSHWVGVSAIILGASGLAWGWAGIAFAQTSEQSTFIVALAVGIIVSNAIAAWISVPYALFAFIGPATAPLLILLAQGPPTSQFVGFLLVLLLLGAGLYAYRIQRGIDSAGNLRQENAQLREDLRLSTTELAALVKNADTIESELNTAKITAEAANMAKGEFLATMSHEIRTPLNGILPILDILRDTKLSTDQTDYLNTAYQSSRHLLAIIDDILDYSKIEAGKLELENVGVSIEELIQSVTQLMARSAEHKGLVLEAKIDAEVRRMVRGDPVRLRQVLTNLVSNAIKFTKRGRVTISVTKESETRTHSEMLFAVTDSGIGMNAATSRRVFEPFSQADASTTRNYGGTGLGLAICKRLVEVMRGDIGVRSNPGRGSVFWFRVPLLKATGDVAPMRTELDDIRTLVVTNDHILYRRMAVYLDRWSMPHLRVDSAGETLKQLRGTASLGESWTYDLLILDLQTLRNSGINLAKNIRQDPVLRTIKMAVVGRESGQTMANLDAELLDRNYSESELHSALTSLMEVSAPETMSTGSSQTISFRPVPSPSAEIPAVGATAGHEKTSPKPAPADNRGQGRVLLVEDNPVNLHVARKLLKVVGYQTDSARHGEEALKLLESNRYTAILMDCQMPVMDGYTTTRKIRAREAGSPQQLRTPIIAMTANAMAGDREKCLDCGMDDYMAKPLSRDIIESTLKNWIQTPPDELPLPAPHPAHSNTRKTTTVIDHKVLDELVDLMGDDIDEVIDIYLEDVPGYVATLQAAAAQNNLEGMVAPSHSLKSSSANLGALRLSEIAKTIEHGAREGTLDLLTRRVEQLRAEFESVATALRNRSR